MKIIDDADKEFLRIDCSATNYLSTILQEGINRNIPEKPSESKKVSQTLHSLLSPECI
jgi:hypothetical protein